jgi:hypothetical protein
MNFLQTVLLALLANPLVFQQAIIPWRGSSSVNVGLSRDTQASPIFLPVDRLQRMGGLAQPVFPGNSCLPSKGASAF